MEVSRNISRSAVDSVDQRRGGIEQFRRRQHGAWHAQALRATASGSAKAAEAQLFAGTQIRDRFGDRRKFPFELRTFGAKFERLDGAAARRGSRAAPQQIAQPVEFQNLFGATSP